MTDRIRNNRVLAFFGSRSGAWTICIATVVVLTAIGIASTYPFANDVTTADNGDDWYSYFRSASSIVDDGLLIEAVEGPYYTPGAFLYNYYVAAVFFVFGKQTGFVYATHYAMIGLAAAVTYLFARRYTSIAGALLLLLSTAVMHLQLMSDLHRRLLSENVAIALFPLALYLTACGLEERSGGKLAAGGALCGALLLMRNNLILIPLLFGLAVLYWGGGRLRERVVSASVFSAGCLAVCSLLPIRNLLASGVPFASGSYGSLMPVGSPGDMAILVAKKMLFNFGVLVGGWNLDGEGIIVNKRLLLLNAAAAFSLLILMKLRRFSLPDALSLSIIVAAYVPFALLPLMGGYGFRFQVPYAPLLVFMIIRAAEAIVERWGLEGRVGVSRGFSSLLLRAANRGAEQRSERT